MLFEVEGRGVGDTPYHWPPFWMGYTYHCDTGFLNTGINKPIVHEDVCHSASDNAKEDLSLYVKQRNRAKVADANRVLIWCRLEVSGLLSRPVAGGP